MEDSHLMTTALLKRGRGGKWGSLVTEVQKGLEVGRKVDKSMCHTALLTDFYLFNTVRFSFHKCFFL